MFPSINHGIKPQVKRGRGDRRNLPVLACGRLVPGFQGVDLGLASENLASEFSASPLQEEAPTLLPPQVLDLLRQQLRLGKLKLLLRLEQHQRMWIRVCRRQWRRRRVTWRRRNLWLRVASIFWSLSWNVDGNAIAGSFLGKWSVFYFFTLLLHF